MGVTVLPRREKYPGLRGFAESLIGGMIQTDERKRDELFRQNELKRAGQEVRSMAESMGIRLPNMTTPTTQPGMNLLGQFASGQANLQNQQELRQTPGPPPTDLDRARAE